MNEELKEVLVELIENNELSNEQLKSVLNYLQGNGFIS
jgi:hypothetical protein